VLDVATGSGNAAIAAARRWCEVVGVDYVPALLARGRERAAAEALPVTFRECDADRVPFDDGSFDVVLSTFGVMFAPDQERAADELLRVCKSGGKIGLANWTPTGFIGRVLQTIGKHVAPVPGLKPSTLWGSEPRLHELFASRASIASTLRQFAFRYRSPQHWLDVFRTFYGPVTKAFAAVEARGGREQLERDLLALLAQMNRSHDETLIVPSDYLEVVLTKR
jgi:ubiquinone/menaquinone biosynthesis C-methylase UbiE